VVNLLKDWIDYLQTVLNSNTESDYTDDQQNDYDCYDTYQGCGSWYDYYTNWCWTTANLINIKGIGGNDMVKVKESLVGKQFGRLTVIE